jgi:cytochrome oxidase Cu insertion factor (SCO1/SenC/PrrC family)
MPQFQKRTIAGLGALLLMAAVGFVSVGSYYRSTGPLSPRKDTEVRLVDLDGKPFDLQKSSTGRVHVVVFIRSDCPVSNRMAPEVRELHTAFQPQGVDFYLIYVDPRETTDAIRAHLQEYEYPCVGLRDPDHTLVAATKATITPEAVVFDDNWSQMYRGRINDQFEDFGKSKPAASKHDLRNAIEATLTGQQVAEPVTKAIGCYIDDLK